MVAIEVARFTLAPLTPSAFFRNRSTRFTHEAQVMPVTGRAISATGVVSAAGTDSVNILRGSIRLNWLVSACG
jgi:hypothetical protein